MLEMLFCLVVNKCRIGRFFECNLNAVHQFCAAFCHGGVCVVVGEYVILFGTQSFEFHSELFGGICTSAECEYIATLVACFVQLVGYAMFVACKVSVSAKRVKSSRKYCLSILNLATIVCMSLILPVPRDVFSQFMAVALLTLERQW